MRQRGAALLAAMLTVTLVATFAAAALWQQWRSVEVEAAERSRIQAAWLLTGMVDFARLILREDARTNTTTTRVDHLAEPWAVPLQEARLSTFLAADRSNNASDTAEGMNAFISGRIVDMQSRLNVTNLIDRRDPDEDVISFRRLFEQLSLPPGQLDTMVQNLRIARPGGNANPGVGASLPPQQVEQLVWLGLPAQTVAILEPYVAILPDRASVNLNTASAEVIYAVSRRLNLADAQRLVSARERSHFRNVAEAATLLAVSPEVLPLNSVSVNSSFFESSARLRLDQLVVEERTLLKRDGNEVRAVQRVRGAAAGGNPAQATGPR